VQQAFSGNGGGTVADEGKTTQQVDGDSAAQPGDRWGDPISEDREKVLRELFERQQEWAV
jgi:hypothetical protein